MNSSIIALILALPFAAVLGFAAHRASICTVRAAAEIMCTKTAFMMSSIVKSALWVTLLTLPLFALAPPYALGGWPVTAIALTGGFLFGVGAAVNGGCAYSTMTRLADGEGRMVVTLGGFALGVLIFSALIDFHWVTRPTPVPTMIGAVLPFAWLVIVVLLAGASYELLRIWRNRTRGRHWKDQLFASQYRLSTAALIIGVSGSIIFLLIRSPGYTITVQNLIESTIGTRASQPAARWGLLLAVLAGMVFSTWQRGSFRIDWRPRIAWLRNLSGGALMGLGTALLPGGNDALVLYGIPTFSPHAVPAYLALCAGTMAMLFLMTRAGVECSVVCRNDVYLAQHQPADSILNSHAPKSATSATDS